MTKWTATQPREVRQVLPVLLGTGRLAPDTAPARTTHRAVARTRPEMAFEQVASELRRVLEVWARNRAKLSSDSRGPGVAKRRDVEPRARRLRDVQRCWWEGPVGRGLSCCSSSSVFRQVGSWPRETICGPRCQPETSIVATTTPIRPTLLAASSHARALRERTHGIPCNPCIGARWSVLEDLFGCGPAGPLAGSAVEPGGLDRVEFVGGVRAQLGTLGRTGSAARWCFRCCPAVRGWPVGRGTRRR